MPKSKLSLVAACLVLLTSVDSGMPREAEQVPVRLMFYNVENLFDTCDDTAKNDDDFLPGSARRWSYQRYRRKIACLYKTIVSAGRDDPPEIVAMCEVEDRKVLNDLVSGTYLSKFNYTIVHEDSPDRRGIDVCLIYRGDSLKLTGYKYWIPESVSANDFNTRSVLYARFAIHSDTFHLIINHWPSRRGGALAAAGLRTEIARMVASKADSVNKTSPSGARIIVAGDFNCTPGDREIKILLSGGTGSLRLINLSGRLSGKDRGTYRYQGNWEMIDQVMVSQTLLTCRKGLFTDQSKLTVFSPGFLLKDDPKYPGPAPFPTYRGYRYEGGFSDHLPVLLDLAFR